MLINAELVNSYLVLVIPFDAGDKVPHVVGNRAYNFYI